MEYHKSLKVGDSVSWVNPENKKLVTGVIVERVRAKTRPMKESPGTTGFKSKQDVSYIVRSNNKRSWVDIGQIIVPGNVKIDKTVTQVAKPKTQPVKPKTQPAKALPIKSAKPSVSKAGTSTTCKTTSNGSHVKIVPDHDKQPRIVPDVFRRSFDALNAFRRSHTSL